MRSITLPLRVCAVVLAVTAPARNAVAHPATPGQHAPAIVVREENNRCVRYADHARRQFDIASRKSGCSVPVDGRWQPHYENHYQWCRQVADGTLVSERTIRDAHLTRCGALHRID